MDFFDCVYVFVFMHLFTEIVIRPDEYMYIFIYMHHSRRRIKLLGQCLIFDGR